MYKEPSINDWLPITRKEMLQHGWEELDIIIISGDAYVDHPAFGAAVIGRIIQAEGFRVGIIPQPNWQDDLRDFKKFGKPRLFFAVTAGNMDSMVNHYTANKRLRSNDAYTPGGEKSFRPDYASIVYSKILKDIYPEIPVVLGGVEASLRRLTHYDYWSDKLMPSILEMSHADLLVYGMGEQPLLAILRLLRKGVPFKSIDTVAQTGLIIPKEKDVPLNKNWRNVELYSHEECLNDKLKFAKNFRHIEQEANKVQAKRILQKVKDQIVVINPPFPTMTEKEIDAAFDLPFTRLPHPKYKKRGPIPAYVMIKFSVNMHRGCFGGCSFCTISAHQGKFIASRSEASIMREVDQMSQMPEFKGTISDLGGPSANMYKMKGVYQELCDQCKRPSCIHPSVCHNLDTSHQALLNIYKKVDAHPGVKHAYIGSGIRYDLLVKDFNKEGDEKVMNEYMTQLLDRHVSGRLKVAPEHTSDNTLKMMRKPSFKYFHSFKKQFDKINERLGKKIQLIPYFISSHPESKLEDMANLASETKDMGFRLEQVQDFTPTPMTVATVAYYSGYHPYTLEKVYTARNKQEKLDQHRFFFWYKSENAAWIKRVLKNRPDLVKNLLSRKPKNQEELKGKNQNKRKSPKSDFKKKKRRY
jgi:uncharacterized radical SAM protein YgiQ